MILLEWEEHVFGEFFVKKITKICEEVSSYLVDPCLKLNSLSLAITSVEVIIVPANLFFLVDLTDIKLFDVIHFIAEINPSRIELWLCLHEDFNFILSRVTVCASRDARLYL